MTAGGKRGGTLAGRGRNRGCLNSDNPYKPDNHADSRARKKAAEAVGVGAFVAFQFPRTEERSAQAQGETYSGRSKKASRVTSRGRWRAASWARSPASPCSCALNAHECPRAGRPGGAVLAAAPAPGCLRWPDPRAGHGGGSARPGRGRSRPGSRRPGGRRAAPGAWRWSPRLQPGRGTCWPGRGSS